MHKFLRGGAKGQNDANKPMAPFTLFPSKFPRKMFDLAEALQPPMSLLYFRASRDLKFLENALEEVAKSDEKIRNMLSILQDIYKAGGYRQPVAVQSQRSDYMLNVPQEDEKELELKQIEVNVGGVGGAPMGRRMTMVHRHFLRSLGLEAGLEVVRDNHPFTTLAAGLVLGWHKFGDPEAILLMVHGPSLVKTNWDLEEEIGRLSSGKLKYVAMPLKDCDERLKLDPEDFTLRLDDGRKVAIVYHRFPTRNLEEEWRARRMIERSTAVKCPTMGMELMGTKKMQQVLAKPGVLEQFFSESDDAHYVEAIRQSFAGLWGMDNHQDKETMERIQDAIDHPERYVLKPMKEGGGNNIFGQEIAEKLQEFVPEERAAHILMQLLRPVVSQNYFIRPNKEPELINVNSEFSTFGCLVGNVNDGTVYHNHGHGYLMRTKWEHSAEGGILVGHGAYDTPYLC